MTIFSPCLAQVLPAKLLDNEVFLSGKTDQCLILLALFNLELTLAMMFQFLAFFIATLYAFAVLSLPITAEAARLPAVYRSEQRDRPAISRRDVYSPKITNPTACTTWFNGSRVSVTWDTSKPPQNITNEEGKIMTDEHLNMSNPLAEGFDIMAGTISFLVPDVTPGHGYIVVLLNSQISAQAEASDVLEEATCAVGI
ncbi:uncharacterized protein EV420DRAFT_1516633 [Desarmillaria tabescens]|uniref:Uncharacterized protein n=1 Tax=Armillaria tabescens TaxID=1929756 RepID=A0AA39NF49_ARMTA|nr:uncharacterized protein EV420DRAFT_1516633 [Desarmillaria tabescens]KAK0464492.1 hypothetical protein EV420DRAFT_1516633 [Desarmillaria tabescens]